MSMYMLYWELYSGLYLISLSASLFGRRFADKFCAIIYSVKIFSFLKSVFGKACLGIEILSWTWILLPVVTDPKKQLSVGLFQECLSKVYCPKGPRLSQHISFCFCTTFARIPLQEQTTVFGWNSADHSFSHLTRSSRSSWRAIASFTVSISLWI